MDQKDFEAMLLNVCERFAEPRDVLGLDVPDAQKVELLRQWEHDLRLLMVASDENMTGDGTGHTATQLTSVRKALAQLDAAEPPENSARTKLGGTAA